MSANKRREDIISLLIDENKPIKGTNLAERFNVTRQVIVKDIAILRAKGSNIIATPDGYMINNINDRLREIIAVCHDEEGMFKELEIVVKYGGIIEDVIIEHPLYGEIKGNLMIKNLNDLNRFKGELNKIGAKPLATLTKGIHLHTISTDCKENLELIKSDLNDNGFIL